MLKKTLTILIALIWVGMLVAAPVDAGKGKQKRGTNRTPSVETQKPTQKGVCPYGNTPCARQGAGRASGYGPGDSSGNDGSGPKDGTGYGAVKQGKGATNPNCDGTGPKGAAKQKGKPG